MVFLVPASTDRISLARPLRKLLTSAAGSLNTIGARDSQVLLFKNKRKNILAVSCQHFDYFLLVSDGRCSVRLQTQNMVPA